MYKLRFIQLHDHQNYKHSYWFNYFVYLLYSKSNLRGNIFSLINLLWKYILLMPFRWLPCEQNSSKGRKKKKAWKNFPLKMASLLFLLQYKDIKAISYLFSEIAVLFNKNLRKLTKIKVTLRIQRIRACVLHALLTSSIYTLTQHDMTSILSIYPRGNEALPIRACGRHFAHMQTLTSTITYAITYIITMNSKENLRFDNINKGTPF